VRRRKVELDVQRTASSPGRPLMVRLNSNQQLRKVYIQHYNGRAHGKTGPLPPSTCLRISAGSSRS
jgi:hypothetical protein